MDAGEIRDWLKNSEYYKVKEYLAGLNEVDLAQLLEEFPDETTLRLTVRSLGTSLCSLETVDEVRFLVDGEFTPKYGTADIEDAYTA